MTSAFSAQQVYHAEEKNANIFRFFPGKFGEKSFSIPYLQENLRTLAFGALQADENGTPAEIALPGKESGDSVKPFSVFCGDPGGIFFGDAPQLRQLLRHVAKFPGTIALTPEGNRRHIRAICFD